MSFSALLFCGLFAVLGIGSLLSGEHPAEGLATSVLLIAGVVIASMF